MQNLQKKGFRFQIITLIFFPTFLFCLQKFILTLTSNTAVKSAYLTVTLYIIQSYTLKTLHLYNNTACVCIRPKVRFNYLWHSEKMLNTFSFDCLQIYQNKRAQQQKLQAIAPIKYMLIISAVEIFCFDKFDDNQTRKFSSFNIFSECHC